MKKIIAIILCLTMLSGLSAYAKDSEITVELDGEKIEFDVNPEVVNGRTMVPLRKIFEKIGALVKWNDDTQTVSARKNSKTITLTVDSDELNIDKGKTDDDGNPVVETVLLDTPPYVVSGRTLVPARAIAESFGFNVEWDEKNNKVIISSDETEDDSWKENETSINLDKLTYSGKGVEIKNKQIKITSGGDYTLKGKLNGNITVSTKEKVKLRLSGVRVTSTENPCIFVEDADKVYITLTDGTENYLVAEKSEDGAIYSKENLEIKGDGKLNIESLTGHGIKASDNLTIEKGNITINATNDGIHINDTFKMYEGKLNITSIGDGIDCESIIIIDGGKFDITTKGTPVESDETVAENTNQNANRFPMMHETPLVEFEKSTKGINAEWMMSISDGEFTINASSHTIHCDDEIEIKGGSFKLNSEYEKGISAHGNLTISGSETTIDITKSTEGLESKNVMTINDGKIRVVSSDDAINATGGKSGAMMGMGGNFNNRENTQNRQPREDGTMPEGFRPGRQNQNANGENVIPNRPNRENGWNGEFKPQFETNENGEFIFPFEMKENGQFTPPAMENNQMNNAGFPMGNMGGMGRNMKECLIINGGYLELCGNDDCVDSNGNMTINGGTVLASNPTGNFTGNFGVLDADGQIKISENANVILASSNGSNLSVPQNSIIVYCENIHDANDKITVTDINENVMFEYTPGAKFKTALIASSAIKTGEKYTITIGNETFKAEIAEKSTVIGTKPTTGGMGFGRGQRM